MLSKAIDAALEAGSCILRIYKEKNLSVEYKENSSPLTQADTESHHVITSALETTPYPVLSEEGNDIPYSKRKEWNTYWLIDPLDGTKEFINGNGDFTVNIALIEKGIPVMGVVYVPVTDTLYFANKSGGAFIKKHAASSQSEAERIQAVPPRSMHLNVVASRSHINNETSAYIEEYIKQGYRVDLINRGSSLKLCQVAEGQAHLYPRFGPTMEWDTAAAHAICREAGAVVMDMETKKELRYNKQNLLNHYFLVYPEIWGEKIQ